MILKKIDEKSYEEFVIRSGQGSMYQSIEWLNLKKLEGKKCELLGLFSNDKLVGVSLIIYSRVLKKYYFAYASRGFIYNYQDILGFKKALIKYFKKKKVIFFRMDPLIVLAKYNKNMKKEEILESRQLIEGLKFYGFKHYGFNRGFETMQFRFVHVLDVASDFDEQMQGMSKSTRKNMELAKFRGVRFRKCGLQDIDIAEKFFEMSSERKHFKGFDNKYYERLYKAFKNSLTLYITYIDKNVYINNINNKLNDLRRDLEELHYKMVHDNVGKKLKNQELLLNQAMQKYKEELKSAKELKDKTDIAAMLTISKYKEVVSYVSGMDNRYRKFNPKYVMYPAMIKDAINENLKTINFLGVKNIFDKDDSDYGVYDVKRGFGGNTLEYVGEFDLPIKKMLYRIYKLKNRLKGGE